MPLRRIETAATGLGPRDFAGHVAWLRELARRKGLPPELIVDPGDPGGLAAGAPPAVAYANHGRWVADCPGGCGAAMLVEPGWPHLCGECFNAELGGRWRPVRWPRQREAIEVELAKRPHPRRANWTPPETLAALRRENRAWGVDA